jgi:hypothetical protein
MTHEESEQNRLKALSQDAPLLGAPPSRRCQSQSHRCSPLSLPGLCPWLAQEQPLQGRPAWQQAAQPSKINERCVTQQDSALCLSFGNMNQRKLTFAGASSESSLSSESESSLLSSFFAGALPLAGAGAVFAGATGLAAGFATGCTHNKTAEMCGSMRVFFIY